MMMGTIPFYVLAFLFIALLGFVYLQSRLFLSIVEKLTKVISDLKSFSMGKPEPTQEKISFVTPKIPDEDYGFVREEGEEEEMPAELDLR